MNESIAKSAEIARFLDQISGQHSGQGNPRVKQLVRRLVADLFEMIEDLDVQPDEFWAAVSFITGAGQNREVGLISPGLGFDHYLDVRLDAAEKTLGLGGGTPRTIEGPLYVADAPMCKGEARLDDGTEKGEVLFMSGRVLGRDGAPLPGAIVDVWHADTKGNYSHFDPTQKPFNLRRRIQTDADGRYSFRSILPRGYGVPPGGSTDTLLQALGRHGQRPAHIHFFISGPGHRHLTTQINIAGDPLLHDDFAFATRDELIPEVIHHSAPEELKRRGVDEPFAEIRFDFVLHPDLPGLRPAEIHRERARADQ